MLSETWPYTCECSFKCTKESMRGKKFFPWVHFKKTHGLLHDLSLIRFQKQSTKCFSQLYKHTNSPHWINKHTHNPHPASTSLFPKGSKRNQPSNRGVLCKQAKGISTCGKKQHRRIEYQTRTTTYKAILRWEKPYSQMKHIVFYTMTNTWNLWSV